MLKTPSKSKYLDQSRAFVEGVQFSSTPQGIHLRTSGVYRVLWIKGEESETIELSMPLKLHPHKMILSRPDGIPHQNPDLNPVYEVTLELGHKNTTRPCQNEIGQHFRFLVIA